MINRNGELFKDSNYEHFYGKGSDNTTLHYVRKGKGREQSVILLHGWPGFWFDWRYIIPELAKEYDIIAPDFRGFGLSDKPNLSPEQGYTPEHLAKDIIYLMNHLKLRKAVFVAHDIGATIAQTIAKKYPEHVEGLVLLNPPYAGIGKRRFDPNVQKEFWYQHLHNLPLAETIIGSSKEAIKHYLSFFYEHWVGSKIKTSPRDLEYILNVYCRDDRFIKSIAYYKARAAAKTAQAVTTTRPEPIFQKTKVLWGEEDPVMLVDWSDTLGEYFSNFTLQTLPGIGHFVPFEAPDHVMKAVKNLVSSFSQQKPLSKQEN